MQDKKNLQVNTNQTPEQKEIALRIEHLLVFQLSVRHNLEQFVFDANDVLDMMPRTDQPYDRQVVLQAKAQMEKMRTNIGYLINELELCAGLIPLDDTEDNN